jgi:hypothetical protein
VIFETSDAVDVDPDGGFVTHGCDGMNIVVGVQQTLTCPGSHSSSPAGVSAAPAVDATGLRYRTSRSTPE